MTLAFDDRHHLYQPVVATTNFAVPFPIFDISDIEVQIDGVVTTAYTVSATFTDGKSSNAVVVLTSPVVNVDVDIYGQRDPRRETNYEANGEGLAKRVGTDIEAVTAVQQEQLRDFGRSIKLPVESGVTYDLAEKVAARANKWLGFDGSGNPIAASTPGGVPVSTFMETLLDDTSAAAARDTLLASGKVLGKSANYTVTTSDRAKVINCTAALTLSLPAAGSAGDGFFIHAFANGGAVVIDPAGSETVNGSATLTLANGQNALVSCTGTGWLALVAQGDNAALEDIAGLTFSEGDLLYHDGTNLVRLAKGAAGQELRMNSGATAPEWVNRDMVKLDSQTASSSANIDFTLPSGYRYFDLVFDSVVPSASQQLYARFSLSGAFKSGASDYGWRYATAGTISNASAGANHIPLTPSVFTGSASGILRIFQAADAALNTLVGWEAHTDDHNNNVGVTSGRVIATEANDGVQILSSTGNMTSGNFALYGHR